MRERHVPLRMCVVCRDLKPREELFRCVRQKGTQQIEPDPDKQLAGKGVYFCRRFECLARLKKERRLRRLFLERLAAGTLDWMEAELNCE